MRVEVPAAAASGSIRSGNPWVSAWSTHACRIRSRISGCLCRPITVLFHVTGDTSTVGGSGRRHRNREKDMRVVFVHGACVRDGSWWWHRAAAALEERGIGSIAPALPSCGEGDRPAGPQGPGLPEDVAAVRAVLTEGEEPIVVVAHSYGGIVAAEAAVGVETVRHLVLVSSYLPE